MSWNKPNNEKVEIKDGGGRRNGLLRNLVACSVIAILSVAAFLFLNESNGKHQQTSPTPSTKQIREVEPSISTNAARNAEIAAKPKERPAQRVGEIRDGFILLSSGELYPVKSVITVSCARVSLEDRSFERFSDRLIGSLLRIEPGEGLLGSSEDLFAGFDKEFEESLAYPIEIKHDDPDDVKEMKQAVIELRKELKERKAKGEDIEKIMIDSRNQLMELATYRDELEQQVEKLMSDNEFSEKDANDLVNAANLMLEERGAKPLDLPVAAIYAIRHMSQEELKEQESK